MGHGPVLLVSPLLSLMRNQIHAAESMRLRANGNKYDKASSRAKSVNDTLDVSGSPIPDDNVLLMDDIVFSGWTLTIAAWLLRSHGSGVVHRFVVTRMKS